MTDRKKRRVAVAIATMLGVTVSASLSARYANQPIWPERAAPTGAMCLELKDSPESAELKTRYERTVETQKQAEADLASAQEAVTAQRKRLSELREQRQQVAADCAAALSEQQHAEWAANREAQRQAAVLAQRQALEAAEKQQAEWQATMTAQQQTMQQAQQKAAEDAQKRQADWQAAMTAQQQATREAQQKAAVDAQKRRADWQAAMTAQQQAMREAQQKAAEDAQKRQAELQERSKAATAEGQYGAPFDTSGYPATRFRAPFEPPQPPAYGAFRGRERNYLPLPGDPMLTDWDYEPERLGFLDGGYADLRKEMMAAHQRRRDEMEDRRYALSERLDALRRERPYGSARFYQTPDRSLAEMCETLSDKRD